MSDWLQTYTGKQFFPMTPDPHSVDLEDIAHALSMQCRFNGHVREFYSVAEHSVLMADAYLRDFGALADDDTARHMLLHDAAEAYVGDMIRPLKHDIPAFRIVEGVVLRAIWARFDLIEILPVVVSEYDGRILRDEKAVLLPETPSEWSFGYDNPLNVAIQCWTPAEAKRQFLRQALDLGVE